MDCLRSFVINQSLNQSFALGIDLATWTIGGENYFIGRRVTAFAEFEVQGFKNVNIYGIDVVGDFASATGTSKAAVDDWRMSVQLIGQAPLLGGIINPLGNALSVNINPAFTNSFQLSRYKTKAEFSSPIQSVTIIRFDGLQVNGHANESLLNVTVNWNLNYIIYYKFEGE